jgi:hypothetical protein
MTSRLEVKIKKQMGNNIGGYDQEFPDDVATDQEAKPQQPSTSMDRGYVSETSTSKKRRSRRHVTTHKEEILTSSIPNETVSQKRTNWWKKFNHGALQEDTVDFMFLKKSDRFIDELMSDFTEMIDMIAETIKQIDSIDPEERKSTIDPNTLKMFDELSDMCIEDTSNMTHKQATKMQKTIAYQYISHLVFNSMESQVSQRSKVINVFELIQFYYDHFFIAYATFIKCNTYQFDVTYDELQHSAFRVLFGDGNMFQKDSRSRMNCHERLAVGMFMDICMTQKSRCKAEVLIKSDFVIEMVLPLRHFKDAKRHDPPKSIEDERNIFAMANLLHMLGFDNKIIEDTTGMRVIAIDSNIEEALGEDAYAIVNKTLLYTIECVTPFLERCDQIWSEVVQTWMSTYCPVVSNDVTSITMISKDTFTKPVLLHREMINFNYAIKWENAKWIDKFFVSSNTMLDDIFVAQNIDAPPAPKQFNFKTDLSSSSLFRFLRNRVGIEDYASLIEHMIVISHVFKTKGFVNALIAMHGVLDLSATTPQNNQFDVTLYREIRPSMLSLIAMNFRFFPIFDITITIAHGEADLRNAKCHLNFENMAPHFSMNNIKYSPQEKRVIINFPITINQIRQTIMHNGKSSIHNKRLPMPDESIFIPINWSDDVDIPTYVREKIQRDYVRSEEFVISKLKIMSFTHNDVVNNASVVIDTANVVDKMCISYASIKDNRMSSSNTAASIVRGTGIIFKDSNARKRIDTERKELVVTHLNNQDVLKNENIIDTRECDPVKSRIRVNNFTTFVQKETNVECIQSFNIALFIDAKSFSAIVEQWMSLYFHWPIATSRAISYHALPSFLS